MINIIDFDYTLFDTLKFRQVALPEFFGQSSAEFDEYYQLIRKKDRGFYSATLQIDALPLDSEARMALKKKLPEYLRKVQADYLMSGSIELLRTMKERGEEIILLTKGDIEWQKMKIENLFVNNDFFAGFFDEIIYVDGSKHENKLVQRYLGCPVRIINDNAKENRGLATLFGSTAEIFLVKSEHSNNIEHEYKIWPDLMAIKEAIIKDDATNS